MDAAENNVLFEERQRFTQKWIWILLGGMLGGMGVVFIIVARCQQQTRNDVIGICLAMGVVLLLMVLMRVLELHVRVVDGELNVRFFPLLRKRIDVAEIRSIVPRTYRPIREYGGWGIRYGIRMGWAYNVRGNRGVQLEFANGTKLLIGSQRAEELAAAIERARADTQA